MIIDFLFLLSFIAVGLAIGVAVLPWYKKLGGDGKFAFLRIFALFWPFLLVDYFRRAVKPYITAWRRYLHSRRSEKLKRQSNGKQ